MLNCGNISPQNIDRNKVSSDLIYFNILHPPQRLFSILELSRHITSRVFVISDQFLLRALHASFLADYLVPERFFTDYFAA